MLVITEKAGSVIRVTMGDTPLTSKQAVPRQEEHSGGVFWLPRGTTSLPGSVCCGPAGTTLPSLLRLGTLVQCLVGE